MPETPRWKTLYPFDSHELKLDGLRYHYLDEGPRDGEPLLLLHGNPTWSFYWRNIALGLRDNYRVIVPDHMGCGLSDKPAEYPYRMAKHIDNVCRLITELDLKNVTLIGHDWGGALGLGAATKMPDRFARFVLMNTAAYRSTWMPWRIAMCRIPIFGKIAVQGFNLFARAALWMAVNKPEQMSSAVRAGLIAPYDSWAHRKALYEFVQDIPMKPSHPSYGTVVEIEEHLGDWKSHPMLFVWGMRDWCFKPQFLERFLDFFPKAEVHRIDEAGHYVVEDAYEEIIPVLRQFLERHPLGEGQIVEG